jgi:hypothetical protein
MGFVSNRTSFGSCEDFMRPATVLQMILLAAQCAMPSALVRPLYAEVVVIAGSAAGRTEKAPGAGHVNEPFAVAYDAAGTLYGVEYTRGNRLFRVTRPGEPDAAARVEFVAGVFRQPDPKVPLPPQATTDPREVHFHGPHDLAVGGDSGPAVDARLAGPKYVVLDRQGRVLIADTENHCIRRYDPASGSIDLVAGTPASGGANVCVDLLSTQLLRPHGCCLDPQGLLVIADSDNDRIIAGEISAVKSR